MTDIEELVALSVTRTTGVQCLTDVPRDRPQEFYSVELSGYDGGEIDAPELTIDSWAETRKRARELSMLLETTALPALVDEEQVFAVTLDNCFRNNDDESRKPRYQTIITLTVCE